MKMAELFLLKEYPFTENNRRVTVAFLIVFTTYHLTLLTICLSIKILSIGIYRFEQTVQAKIWARGYTQLSMTF